MQSKDYLLPLIIIPIGIAFLIISAFVFFYNGRSARLLRYKMRIGAFLLTFSFFSSLTAVSQERGQVLCYEMPMEISKQVNVKYNSQKGGELVGSINILSKGVYTYQILNSRNKSVQYGVLNITPKSGEDYYNKYVIKLEPKLKKGNYKLKISLTENKQTRVLLQTTVRLK